MKILFLLSLFLAQSASAFEVNSCTVDTTLTLAFGTPDTVPVLNGNSDVVSSPVTATELGYIQNVTSDVQTQLNSKQSALTFIDSLTNSGGNVSLVGDSATPGDTKYYGTNSSGTLGYYTLSQGVSSVTASLPLSSSGGATPDITCQTASGSQAGCLASADWTTFNGKQSALTFGNFTVSAPFSISGGSGAVIGSGSALSVASGYYFPTTTDESNWNGKQSALTFGNLTDAGTDGITVGSGSGAVIGSGTSISQHVADTTHNGYLASADWNTFNSKQGSLTPGTISSSTTGVSVGSGTNSTVGPNVTINVQTANTSQPGLLDATDWTTFNGKQAALTFSSPLVNTASTVTCNVASGSQAGCIASADWTTFNGKQASGNYITALTSDVNASGPGSVAATVAAIQGKTVSGTTGTTNVVFSTAPTFTGAVNMGSHQVNFVTDPTSAQDAATKNYVDTVASGLQPIQAVYAATTGSDIAGTYVQVGGCSNDTFTVTATGALSIDGVSPSANSRVLLKDQTSGAQNGVYVVTVAGSLGVSPVLTRASDYSSVSDINAGSLVPVINGTLNATTSWLQTATITSCGSSGSSLVFTEWTANPSSYLVKANNLSDLSSRQTALNNLVGAVTSGDYLRCNGTNCSIAAIQSGDVPPLNQNTTGNAATATALAATPAQCSSGNYSTGVTAGGVANCNQVNYNQLAGILPNPTATSLGGIESLANTSHEWINAISTSGVPSATQPAFTDISGTASNAQIPNPTLSALGGIEAIASTAHEWINAISTSGVPSQTQPAFTDISGSVAATQLPNPTATSLGGIESLASTTHQWINAISTSGVPSQTQPAFTDISGTALVGQGGLGITSTPTNGQIPIGNGTNYTAAVITPGSNITVTNASGSITIAETNPLPSPSPSGQQVTSTGTGYVLAQTLPSGMLMPFAGTTCPSGWLAADGSLVSTTTYAALFTAISTTYGSGSGTFGLPNSKGVFLRGAGSQTISAISYTGTQGTTQGDQLQGHSHTATSVYMSASGGGTGASTGGGAIFTTPVMGDPTSDGSNGTPRYGTETRPANISVLYCIKT